MPDPTYRFKRIDFAPKVRENEERAKTQYTCYLCGRDIEAKKDHYMIHAIHGGLEVLHPDDEALYKATNDSGDLGGHPVGPTCVKKRGLVGWATVVPPLAPEHWAGYGVK